MIIHRNKSAAVEAVCPQFAVYNRITRECDKDNASVLILRGSLNRNGFPHCHDVYG